MSLVRSEKVRIFYCAKNMITRKQKEEITGELAKKFAEEKIAIFSRVHGVSVAKLAAFRRELKKIKGAQEKELGIDWCTLFV